MSDLSFQWSVFRAQLDPTRGSEQAGTRPVLIVSQEAMNSVLPVVTVLPITSLKVGRRIYSTEVLLLQGSAGLPQDSLVMAHQIRTLAKERLLEAYGQLGDEELRQKVRQALKTHLGLD